MHAGAGDRVQAAEKGAGAGLGTGAAVPRSPQVQQEGPPNGARDGAGG